MGTENLEHPIVNTKNKKIDQIGIVVKDAHKTAKQYSEIFGIGPWVFIDFAATDVVFKNQPIEDGTSRIRAAMANLGKIQIELLQPLYGPGTHASFLKEHGEGVHHVSFGMVDDHDQAISALEENQHHIEMAGVLGDEVRFTYVDTVKDLGTIFELVKPPSKNLESIKPWGSYAAKGPGLINLDGKEIRQVGIVVEDAEKTAKNYWQMFGIGPWMFVDFKPPFISDGILHDIAMFDGIDFHVKAALADFGDMQIELLEPVAGPSTYMEFLRTHGQGVHHLSFGEAEDHDEVVSVLKNHWIDIEMSGVLGTAIRFTYMATQKELGTIFEVIKTNKDKTVTLVPYGSYPPSD